MVKAKVGVALVAAILVGAGVFAFVAFTTFDAVGFGKVVSNEPFTPTNANQTLTLAYSPAAKPIVTFVTVGNVYNGTVDPSNITWYGNRIWIFDTGATWNEPNGPYRADTTALHVNYTSRGAAARAIAMPAIILVAVFAIVIVAGVMMSELGGMGAGKKGKGGKSFP